MFGDKLKAAQERTAQLTALVAATGVDLKGDALPTAEALQAHLASAQAEHTAAAVAAATAPLQALVTGGEIALAAAQTRLAAHNAGFEAFGIRLGAGEPTADSIKAALETTLAARAAKQIAGAGHPAIALAVASGDEPAETTSAEVFKQFNAIADPHERAAFYRKNKSKLLS